MTTDNMTTEPYRTPGRAVDETEVELAKVKEAAATKRHAAELKAKASHDAREKRAAMWRDSELALPLAVVAPTLSACAIVVMYFVHLWFKP